LDLTLATPEVEIPPARGKAVEALNRRRERLFEIRRQFQSTGDVRVTRQAFADRLAQGGERRALDHVGIVRARRHDEASVLVAGAVLLAALVPDRDQQKVRIFGTRAVPLEE